MDKYLLFSKTEKGVPASVIRNTIDSLGDMSLLKSLSFQEFTEKTGIKKEEYFDILKEDADETSPYSIYALSYTGLTDRIASSLYKHGFTHGFMLYLYPDFLLKEKLSVTDVTLNRIKASLEAVGEGVDRNKKMVKEYLEKLSLDTEYMTILKKLILRSIKEDYISLDELMIKIPSCYSYGSILDIALDELTKDEFIENSLFGIKKLQSDLKEFLFSISEDKTSLMLKDYLLGVDLDKLSSVYAIPKDKIKPALQKYDFPVLTEDEYFDFYYSYYFTMDDFTKIFAESPSVFRYLALKAKQPMGRKNILEMLDDARVREDVRVRLQNTLGKYAKIHGESVLKTPADILDIYARFNLKNAVTFTALYDDFKKFWYSLFHEEMPLSEKSLVNVLDASRLIIEGKSGYRYYNTALIDAKFYEILDLSQYKDIEISAKVLFDSRRFLMKSFGILDEYELYMVLKKTVRRNTVDFSRKPVLVFGNGNRSNQIKSIMFEMSPVSMTEFTRAYARIFGVNEKSFAGYVTKQFSPYYSNGTFTVNVPKLNDSIFELYKNLLTEDFYFISDIEALAMKSGIPFQEYYFNKEMLKALGYEDGIRCIYRDKYLSLHDYVTTLFKDRLNLRELNPKFQSLPEFQEILTDKIVTMEYVEMNPGEFISLEELGKYGITKEKIIDFTDKVKGMVYEDEVFTITSLRNKGFTHEILNDSWSDYFYSALFMPDKAYRAQRVYSKDTVLLRLKVNKELISITALLEQIIESKYYMYLEDIKKDLSIVYGIDVTDNELRMYLSLSEIYQNPDTGLYYLNYETYKHIG